MTDERHDSAYLRAYNGLLKGILRWPDLDAVWARLQQQSSDGWYIYTIGEVPPIVPASPTGLERFLAAIRQRLLDEHKQDYCGIVYADDLDEPRFVKIYDPANLGMVCGSSAAPPLPGWTLSRVPPVNVERLASQPDDRRKWWRRVFG